MIVKIFFLSKEAPLKLILLILMVLSLISCSSSFFKKDKSQEPLPLLGIDSKVKLIEQWGHNLKHGQGKLQSRISLGFDRDHIYAASINGLTVKYDMEGELIWSKKVEKLSSGIGVGEIGLAVVNTEGYLVFIEKKNGDELWRKNLSSEVLASPKISNGIVVVQTYDGRLLAFNNLDGKQLWVHTVDVPTLTLRGTSTPVIENKRIFSGFSNGKLKNIDLDNGNVIWEQAVAIARGESDIQRIVDIEGSPLISSNKVFAASYNGNLMAFNKSNGRPLWRNEISTYLGLAEGFRSIYSVDENSSILAFDSASGDLRWKQDSLLYRDLSGPVVFKGYLLVLDFDGYLHVMSQLNGNIIGRKKISSLGARAPMIVKEENLFIYTDDGKLVVYNLENITP